MHGRLKQIKAVLSKCHDNGWYESMFWKNIKIKVNTSVKEATTERELTLLLSLLDKSTYSGLRDSIAILLLYKTGIRIKTLGLLREQNIDFDNMLLKLQGEIMKAHRPLILPLDDEMCTLLRELISINDGVRKEHREKNDYIFLSNIGVPISNTVSPSNLIAKNLWVYSKKWNLKNVNPHSIRRLYAQNLVKRGADINLVSHALAHSDLSTTSKYLGLNVNNVARNLREFL
ncbi:tyrosine-type recombinase/integrase [Lysinibacillus xylanilyticus]|uniref:tyrosine-type recombinase/integrase n=1 Tax=Lysinibacillus xylanilyticus TaxID=582475 RepID=UPI000A9B2EF2|nr:site-specific integrase [Lysinibacillus xylanilyticus]